MLLWSTHYRQKVEHDKELTNVALVEEPKAISSPYTE